MPREQLPTLNLEQVQILLHSENPAYESCNIYGLFVKETSNAAGTSWHVFDEIKELQLKLCGVLSEYPRPRPGDVVRVHRLRINHRMKSAEIVVPKNVVIWPAFQHNAKPIHLSRNPTITDEDNIRRRILETLYSSKIDTIADIIVKKEPGQYCSVVAGRIETIQLDTFQHLEFDYTDGTGKLKLRVFKKIQSKEEDDHFVVAAEMQKGQYFVATNVKYDAVKRVNLSANLAYGRSLRPVEPASILGTLLREAIGDDGSQNATSTSSQGQRRKSPRLLKQSQEDNLTRKQSNGNNPANVPEESQNVHATATSTSINELPSTQIPKFTFFNDLRVKSSGYEFYDIIGQVREKPLVSAPYNNCFLQIYDGSHHNHVSFYGEQVGRVVDGCLVILIYSKQRDTDTDEHSEKAKALKEGDILYIKNVRVSSIQGKIKLELSANKLHDKSINVIDKETQFGRRVLDIVETPQVQETRGMIENSSEEHEDC